jgi:hypothetical protein
MRPPPFPTPKDVDRVMEFKPLQYSGETAAARAKRESDCRETVALVLRQLRKYDMTPISRVRQHLERYAKKLRSTRDMLLRGAPGVYNLWGSVDYQAGKLDVLRLERAPSPWTGAGSATRSLRWGERGRQPPTRFSC